MKKVFITIFLTSFFSTAFCGYKGGITITRMHTSGSNLYVGLSSSPSECTGSYYNVTAYLPLTESPESKAKLSLMLTAKSTGEKIDIWYSGSGDCTSTSNLVKINNVGFSN